MTKKPRKSFEILGLKIKPIFWDENKFLIAGLIFGLILLIIGFVQLFSSNTTSSQIEIVPESTEDASGEIFVDVAGAVTKPGVYKLNSGSRIGNVIEAADGLSNEADLGWVAKNLNLAATVSDGAKIYIPKKGEAATTLGTSSIPTQAKINLNLATQSQLESLPGVGPVTAGKIINGRPYNSVDELLAKKIVGQSTFGKIEDLISVF